MSTTPTYNLNPENWEKEFDALWCDKCRADEVHQISACGVEQMGGLYATKGFIEKLLAAKEQEFVEKLESTTDRNGEPLPVLVKAILQEYKQGRPNQE